MPCPWPAHCSGNVSLYNETPEGPILPTPVVGTVGLLIDRSRLVPMRWREGHEIWLLGDPGLDPSALAASELAWRSGRRGGTPQLEIDAGAAVVQLLVALAGDGVLAGAHDLSVGGLGVALARMAIASDGGAVVSLPRGAAEWPTAALFGERTGRVLVAVAADDAPRVADAAAGPAFVPNGSGRPRVGSWTSTWAGRCWRSAPRR